MESDKRKYLNEIKHIFKTDKNDIDDILDIELSRINKKRKRKIPNKNFKNRFLGFNYKRKKEKEEW